MTDLCERCGFDLGMPRQDAIAVVAEAPGRFSAIFADGPGEPSVDPERWSAIGYLWHVVDVLRFGTERLWMITLDADHGTRGWDQELLAAGRRYESLSPVVGQYALERAVDEWLRAVDAAPDNGSIEHPELGLITTDRSIVRNAHEAHHHALDAERELAEGRSP